jgi:hypothetical protein
MVRESGSQQTRRWREADSNLQSRSEDRGFPGEDEHLAAYAGSTAIAFAGCGLSRSRLAILGSILASRRRPGTSASLPQLISRFSEFRGLSDGAAYGEGIALILLWN